MFRGQPGKAPKDYFQSEKDGYTGIQMQIQNRPWP